MGRGNSVGELSQDVRIGALALSSASIVAPPNTQVSLLSADAPPRHWFTGSPDPQRSIFKPFLLSPGAPLDGSTHTAALPAARNPPTALWQAWQRTYEQKGGRRPAAAALRELEERGLAEDGGSALSWATAVEEELRLYGS